MLIEIALLLSAPLGVLAFLPTQGLLGAANDSVGAAVGVVAATLTAIVTGITQYDAVMGWERASPAPADPDDSEA